MHASKIWRPTKNVGSLWFPFTTTPKKGTFQKSLQHCPSLPQRHPFGAPTAAKQHPNHRQGHHLRQKCRFKRNNSDKGYALKARGISSRNIKKEGITPNRTLPACSSPQHMQRPGTRGRKHTLALAPKICQHRATCAQNSCCQHPKIASETASALVALQHPTTIT